MKKNLKLLIGGLVESEYDKIIEEITNFINNYGLLTYAITGSCAIAVILHEVVTKDLLKIIDQPDKDYILKIYTKLNLPSDLDIKIITRNRQLNISQNFDFLEKYGYEINGNSSSVLFTKKNNKDYFKKIDMTKEIGDYQNSIIIINGINFICLIKLYESYKRHNRTKNKVLENGTGINKKDFLEKLIDILSKYNLLNKYINLNLNNSFHER
jgi:hypothetical protein